MSLLNIVQQWGKTTVWETMHFQVENILALEVDSDKSNTATKKNNSVKEISPFYRHNL